MAHNRNSCPDNGLNPIDHIGPAFNLYRLCAAFLDKPTGIGHRFFIRGLVGHKRHVANQQGVVNASPDRTGMVDHFVHGNGEGVLVSQGYHPDRIPDQNDIDPAFIDQPGGAVIIGGQCGNFSLVPFPSHDCRNGGSFLIHFSPRLRDRGNWGAETGGDSGDQKSVLTIKTDILNEHSAS